MACKLYFSKSVWGKKKRNWPTYHGGKEYSVERITFEMIRVAIESLASAGSELSFWSKRKFYITFTLKHSLLWELQIAQDGWAVVCNSRSGAGLKKDL